MRASYFLGAVLGLALICAGAGRVAGQDEDKTKVAVLLSPQLRGFKDKVFAPLALPGIKVVDDGTPPHFQCLRSADDQDSDAYPATIVVGSSTEVLKKDPDVKFILHLKSYAFVPPAGFGGQPSNQVQYALYYRPNPKKAATLLGSHVLNLGAVNPQQGNPWGLFRVLMGDSLADALAPKIVAAKPFVYPQRFLFPPMDPVKKVAFLAKHEPDGPGKIRGSLTFKNKLPVKVRIAEMEYVEEANLSGKSQGNPNLLIQFGRAPVLAPGETRELTWSGTQPNTPYVRLRRIIVGAP